MGEFNEYPASSREVPAPPPPVIMDYFLQDIISWVGSIAVPNGRWLNYISLPNISVQPGGTLGLVKVQNEIKFPAEKKPSQVTFNIRVTGVVGGSSGASREWLTQIRRTDGETIVSSSGDVKVSGADINNRDTTINSFTRDDKDEFTIKGAQVGILNISAQTITITSVTIRVQRIVNPE